jgi:hypothetical protein
MSASTRHSVTFRTGEEYKRKQGKLIMQNHVILRCALDEREDNGKGTILNTNLITLFIPTVILLYSIAYLYTTGILVGLS